MKSPDHPTLAPRLAPGRTRGGVIGCGYWGPHLVRNLHEIGEVDLLAVSDPQPQPLAHPNGTADLAHADA